MISKNFARPGIISFALAVAILLPGWSALAETSGTSSSQWSSARYSDDCGREPPAYMRSPLVFSGEGERTHDVYYNDLSEGGEFRFWLKAGLGPSPCETADPGDALRFEYTHDGYDWTEIGTYEPPLFYEWQEVTVPVPPGAKQGTPWLRFRQLAHDGAGFDVWALGSVRIPQSYSSALVTYDDFEDEVINPTLWMNSTGATETNGCAGIAYSGAGLLSYANGGGTLESRPLPTTEADSSAPLEYRLRMLPTGNNYAANFPECPMVPYFLSAGVVETTFDHVSWTYLASFGMPNYDYIDRALPQGTTGVRIHGPNEPWMLDDVWIGPAPYPAIGSVTNLSIESWSEFTFVGGAAAVHFNYDAMIDACQISRACPVPSEWRIIIDGPTTDGPAYWLGGQELARGRAMHPAHGETLRHVAAATFTFDNQSAGDHKLAVAVRAPEGSDQWQVRVADLKLIDRNDLDADGVPDALEEELCIRDGVRQVFDSLQGAAGSCASTTNFILPPTPAVEERVFIPQSLTAGPDADQDDVPSYVTVYGSNLVLGTGSETARIEPADPVTLYLDSWDNNADLPLPSTFCSPIQTPSGIVPGDDADGDGIPGSVIVYQGSVCVDRRTAAPKQLWFEPSAAQPFVWGLDPDDSDADVPVPQSLPPVDFEVDTGDKLFIVGVSEDHDNDGIVAGYYFNNWRITYNHTNRDLKATNSSSTTQPVDEDDNDPDKPVQLPISRRDDDKDYVPDTAESEICKWEDPRTPLDGECTILGDYSPPPAYQLVMRTLWGSF